MRSLVRAELTRLRWRRAVVILLAAMVIVPALLLVAQLWDTRPVSSAELTMAEQHMAASNADTVQSVQECTTEPDGWGLEADLSPEEVAEQCKSMMASSIEDWLPRPELDVASFRTETGAALTVVVGLLAGLLGATFAGHDWASGSMSNQLLFESRRTRVWVAKLVAVALMVAAVTAVVLALVWLTVWAFAASRDVSVGAGVWGDVLRTQLRGVALVTGVAALAYALTMWFRSTVGALGVMFGVFALGSIVMAVVLPDGGERWTIGTNAYAVLAGEAEYWTGAPGPCSDMGDCNEYATVSAAQGALYLGALMAAVAVPSLLSFRRRDLP